MVFVFFFGLTRDKWPRRGQVTDTHTGYARRHRYDALGRAALTDTTVRIGATAGSEATWYSRQTWDAYGRPHQFFDAARRREDWRDNAVEVQYNAWGHVHRWVDAVYEDGAPRRTYRTVTFRDARGNATGETLGGGAVRVGRAYDAKTGRVTSVTGRGAGHERLQTLSYDARGNITSKTGVGDYTYGTTAGNLHYRYDGGKRIATLAAHGLNATTYSVSARWTLIASSTASISGLESVSSRFFSRDLSAAIIWSAIALLLCPPTETMASPGYCLPMLLVIGTTTTRVKWRLAASLLTITAGRVLRTSLPSVGPNSTHHTSPRIIGHVPGKCIAPS